MDCTGYVTSSNTTNSQEMQETSAHSSEKLVQFKWLKSKPTLAREAHLLSSLTDSVLLKWNEIEECFMSENVKVPCGFHECQLVLDGDVLPTKSFMVNNNTPKTVEIFFAGDNTSASSSNNLSDDATHLNAISSKEKSKDGVSSNNIYSKGTLYDELIKHQILYGDSFERMSGHAARGNSRDINDSYTSYDGVSSQDTGTLNKERSTLPDLPTQSCHTDELSGILQSAKSHEKRNISRDEKQSLDSDNEEPSDSDSPPGEFKSRPEIVGESNGESVDDGSVDGCIQSNCFEEDTETGNENFVDRVASDIGTVTKVSNGDDLFTGHLIQTTVGNTRVQVTEDFQTAHNIAAPRDVVSFTDNTQFLSLPITPSAQHIMENSKNQSTAVSSYFSGDLLPSLVSIGDSKGNKSSVKDYSLIPDAEFIPFSAKSDKNRLEDLEKGSDLRSNVVPVTTAFEMNVSKDQLHRNTSIESLNDGSLDDVHGTFSSSFFESDQKRYVSKVGDSIANEEKITPKETYEHLKDSMITSFSAPSAQNHGDNFTEFVSVSHSRASYSPLTTRTTNESFLQDIRYPISYQTQSYSSSVNRSHTAISPLSSPRGIITNTVSAPRLSYVLETGDKPFATGAGAMDISGSVTKDEALRDCKQFSDEKIREMLDSLEFRYSRRSPTYLEMATPSKLADREDIAKKLQTENAEYRKKNHELEDKLREALSLVKTKEDALKEQEDLTNELTTALSIKDKEYSELETENLVLKKDQRLKRREMEETINEYEKSLFKSQKLILSLQEEIKVVREQSTRNSPRYSEKYKKLLRDYEHSIALSASMKNRVKQLEEEIRKRDEKIDAFTSRFSLEEDNITSSHRHDIKRHDAYWPQTTQPRDMTSRSTFNSNHRYDNDSPYTKDNYRNSDVLLFSEDYYRAYQNGYERTKYVPSDPHDSPRSSRESRSRRRFMASGDGLRGYSIPKRSHSSESVIKNDWERSSSQKSHHLNRAGSHEVLPSKSTTPKQFEDFSLDDYNKIKYNFPSSSTSPKRSPGKGSPFAPNHPQELHKGMKILVSRTGGNSAQGVLRYIGRLPGKEEKIYVGVELHQPDGKHDGIFNGKRLFECKPGHGIFVKYDKVIMAYR
ncbi:uncharacterized protein LOC124443175 isoform X3 [Xenia sp. Carnegie-2017]|nr:uncharacterized protein LOC124443175 isoform X3 [Xenia sp. Carnegie-2017]XP_046849663.1 uncharacterized protein LOC124443175 isoform X3 [Xenia sp. Carnegie-2017]